MSKSIKVKLITLFIALALVFAGCGLALALGSKGAGSLDGLTASNTATASTHTATTGTASLVAYKNGANWSLTRNSTAYSDSGRVVSVKNTKEIKCINQGTVTLYSPVYGFYEPTNLIWEYGAGKGIYGTMINYNVSGSSSQVDCILKYDYVVVSGVQFQTLEGGTTSVNPVWSDTVTFSGTFYMPTHCLSSDATEAPFTSTDDSFTAHFFKRCWNWTYWDKDNGVSTAVIFGRCKNLADTYVANTAQSDVIRASTYEYVKAKVDAGKPIPALYFLNGAGVDLANKVTKNNYNQLSYACAPSAIGTDGHINYWFSTSERSKIPANYLLEWAGPFTLGGFTLDHTVRWYNSGTAESPSFPVHSDSYQDRIIGVEHFASGTAAINLKVFDGNTLKNNLGVSGIRIVTNSNMYFGSATDAMYDYLKISDYRGYSPTPLKPTEVEKVDSSIYFHYKVNTSGYSIISLEGVAFWIIWIEIDSAGNVTDLLQQFKDSDNKLENFTVLIKEGFARNRLKFTQTFTYVANGSNEFAQTGNSVCRMIINDMHGRCYELVNQGTQEGTHYIGQEELEYDDINNCYILRVAYSAPDHDDGEDHNTSLFGVNVWWWQEGHYGEAEEYLIDAPRASYLALDDRTAYDYDDDNWANWYSTTATGDAAHPNGTVGQWIYYLNGRTTPDNWKDSENYATVYIAAVGGEPYIIRVYCYTPALTDFASTGATIAGTTVTMNHSTETFTFHSVEPMRVTSYSGDGTNYSLLYSYDGVNKYYAHTLTVHKESTPGVYSLVIGESLSGASITLTIRSSHSFSYTLNLSETMNVKFGTETVTGNYSIKSAKVTWKGKTTDVDAVTGGGWTVWTCKNISPHNGADAITFAVTLSYKEGGVEIFTEEFSFTKSIVGYCYEILNETDYAGEIELLTLVVDTLHYCSKSYEYIYGGTCTWDSSDNLSATANLSGKTLSNYTNAYPVSDGSLDKYDKGTGVRAGDLGDAEKGTTYTAQYIRMAFDSAQMVVDGDPYINIVVAANENFGQSYVTKTCTIDDVDYAITFKKGAVYQEGIEGIKQTVYYYTATIMVNPTKFDAEIKVTCTYSGTAPLKAGSASSMTLIYSVNSYAYRTVHKAGAPDKLVNAAKAMYSYGKSAYEYMVYISGYSDFV